MEVDNDQLRPIMEALTTTQEAGEELNVDHFMVICYLKQIGKVKKLDKWVPNKLIKTKKSFLSVVISYSMKQQ